MKIKLEDFPVQCRFYTGLYSTKVFNLLKSHAEYNTYRVVRSHDNEVVVGYNNYFYYAPYNYTSYNFGPTKIEISLDYLKTTVLNVLCGIASTDAKLLIKFFKNEAIPPEYAKQFNRLRGKPKDDVAAELSNCLDEEIQKIENEHKFFKDQLNWHFDPKSSIIGQYGSIPGKMTFRPLADAPFDTEKLKEFEKALAEMVNANNLLSDAFNSYFKKYDEFKDIQCKLIRLNSDEKAKRIKELKAEFSAAKRNKSNTGSTITP